MSKKAVIVLSGGLDSTTCAAIAKADGFDELYGLTFFYGQRHEKELERAAATALRMGFKEHQVLHVPIDKVGGGALIDGSELPVGRGIHEMSVEVPTTYITFRNGIFLSIAAAYAEARGADAIYTGVTAVDYSGYPDCRKEFIEAMEKAIEIGTKAGSQDGRKIKIMTPLLFLNKKAIIARGLELGVEYDKTWSCYAGGEKACGECDSCKLRVNGFRELGKEDPLEYAIPQAQIR